MKFQLWEKNCGLSLVLLGTSWGNTSTRENVGKTFGKQIGDMVGTSKSKKIDPSTFSPPKGEKRDLGTYREQIGDMVGTPKSQKNCPLPLRPLLSPQRKKIWTLLGAC
jgi:hypothetical protein